MEILRVLDPRINFETETHKVIALSGASFQNAVTYPTNSISQSGVTIQCVVPSERVAVDSYLGLHMTFSVQINGRNSSTLPLCVDSMVAPSFLPIQQIISSQSISLNSSTAQIQNGNLFMPAIVSAYDGRLEGSLDSEWSMTPSMPDFSAQFLQLPISATSLRNPLANAYDQTLITPRGAHIGWTTQSNEGGGTTSNFTLDATEPISVSPFKFGKDCFSQTALTNINSLLYIANIGNLNRIVSIAYNVDPVTKELFYDAPDGSGRIYIDSVIVNVTKAEILSMNYSLYEDVPRPLKIITPYANVIDYNSSQFQSLASGQGTTLTLQNQTLSSVPRSFYCYAPVQADTFTQTTLPYSCAVPVAFLQWGAPAGYNSNTSFKPVSLNFDNLTQFNGLTNFDLYKMSKKNGCSMNYSEWVGNGSQYPYSTGKGTILKANFAEDVTLNQGVVVGLSGKYNFSISVNVWNQSQWSIANPVLHVVVVYDGVAVLDENTTTSLHQACFSPADVANTRINPHLRYHPVRQLFGGNFLDSLKSFFSPIGKILKDTKLISTLAPLIPEVGPMIGNVASAVGLGYRRRPASRKASHRRRGGIVLE